MSLPPAPCCTRLWQASVRQAICSMPLSDDLRGELRDKSAISGFVPSKPEDASGFFAIRIEGSIRRNYSLDTLPRIDGIAFNAEIVRLVFQNEGVAAGG